MTMVGTINKARKGIPGNLCVFMYHQVAIFSLDPDSFFKLRCKKKFDIIFWYTSDRYTGRYFSKSYWYRYLKRMPCFQEHGIG